MAAKQESNLSTISMIRDRIGRQEVLSPVNHNPYNFQKQQIHLGQISPKCWKKFLHLGKFLSYFSGLVVIVINGFGWVDLVWLAALTFRLHSPITLSDYSCREWLVENKVAIMHQLNLRKLKWLWLKEKLALSIWKLNILPCATSVITFPKKAWYLYTVPHILENHPWLFGRLVLFTLRLLKVTSIWFLSTISPLNHTFKPWE